MPDAPAIPLVLADLMGQLIVLILILGVGAIRQILSELANANKRKKRPPQPEQQQQRQPLPPRPVEPRQQAQKPRPGTDLRSEVDDFLRRARGEAVVEVKPEEPPRPERPPLRSEPLAPREPEATPHETVGQHVQQHIQHLEESQLAEQAAHLGEQVALADEKVQARLDAKFEHQLGRIKQRDPAPGESEPAATPVVAEEIARMLTTPEGMRNAVILNEILQRPSDRW